MDRDLFIHFRNKSITINQVRAWIVEKSANIEFKCFDDLKQKYGDENFTNLEQTRQLLKNMREMYISQDIMNLDARCLKSIFSVY